MLYSSFTLLSLPLQVYRNVEASVGNYSDQKTQSSAVRNEGTIMHVEDVAELHGTSDRYVRCCLYKERYVMDILHP